MEIFTFCKFNGSTDAIALHTIGEPSVTNKSLANFNAANAKCYLLRDRRGCLPSWNRASASAASTGW